MLHLLQEVKILCNVQCEAANARLKNEANLERLKILP